MQMGKQRELFGNADKRIATCLQFLAPQRIVLRKDSVHSCRVRQMCSVFDSVKPVHQRTLFSSLLKQHVICLWMN